MKFLKAHKTFSNLYKKIPKICAESVGWRLLWGLIEFISTNEDDHEPNINLSY